MAQQGISGTAQQRADLNEPIPASEFRAFMREMREFKQDQVEFNKEMREFRREINQKIDALIQAGNDQDQQIVEILNELGKLRKNEEK